MHSREEKRTALYKLHANTTPRSTVPKPPLGDNFTRLEWGDVRKTPDFWEAGFQLPVPHLS
jgi:hypothetical protein